MRFAVDAWDPSYGSALESDPTDAAVAPVELSIERESAWWSPITPGSQRAGRVAFVDGVRRVEARVWLAAPDSDVLSVAAQCASWAAGAVLCAAGQPATIASVIVGRTLAAAPPGAAEPLTTRHATYTPVLATSAEPPALWLAIQEEMARGERRASEDIRRLEPDALIIVDGPLRGRDHLEQTVGYIKSHHVRYLEGAQGAVIDALEPGQRTPLFLIGGPHPRLSWYVRLETASSPVPLAGCARCEAPPNVAIADASVLADTVAATLVRFISDPVKDRRAPQNLYPIAGLERHLRHRLGDQGLLTRALRTRALQSFAA